VQRLFPSGPWVWDDREAVWRTDALHYAAVRKVIRESPVPIDDHVTSWMRVDWPRVDIHPLRDEQQAAVEAWRGTGRGVVVMPTGTGKTEVALHIMAKSRRGTLIVSPVRDLMYQWHRRIQAGLGYDAGIIGDNVFRLTPVSVTTYDSACIHMHKLGNRFELLIFDECHHLPGGLRREAALMSAAPFRLGLTATLERADGRHRDLDELIGPVVYELAIDDVRGKTLADYEVIRIVVHLSADERQRYDELSRHVREYMMRRRENDPGFTWEDLCKDVGSNPDARAAMRSYRAKMAIEERAEEKLRVLEDLFRLHAGSPCLVFAGSNAMARDISRRFLVPCLLSHCGKRERLDAIQGLAEGRYPVLVANRVLDEGVDLPSVNVAIVVGGGASTRQAKQRLGRVLRRSGNAKAVLYEVVTDDTNEVKRSRTRRANDAYSRTRHRRH
ncbi:MAG: DEAD/DEAH box helicase family protein, partial [Planctomycetales bacterium]|nr:DEAD/DEAH box helicase family protein [Planctomycetales bacterium]